MFQDVSISRKKGQFLGPDQIGDSSRIHYTNRINWELEWIEAGDRYIFRCTDRLAYPINYTSQEMYQTERNGSGDDIELETTVIGTQIKAMGNLTTRFQEEKYMFAIRHQQAPALKEQKLMMMSCPDTRLLAGRVCYQHIFGTTNSH